MKVSDVKRWAVQHQRHLLYGGAAALAVALTARRKVPPRLPREEVREILTSEATRQGMPVNWVMAWASLESGFNTSAVGDTWWPFRACRPGRGCYQKDVLENPAYAGNPHRTRRSAWVSYGLFQLLSPFWLKRAIEAGLAPADAPPEILMDGRVNARLGVGIVKDLFTRTGGDFVQSRYIFVGCPTRRCPPADRIARRASAAMEEWSV